MIFLTVNFILTKSLNGLFLQQLAELLGGCPFCRGLRKGLRRGLRPCASPGGTYLYLADGLRQHQHVLAWVRVYHLLLLLVSVTPRRQLPSPWGPHCFLLLVWRDEVELLDDLLLLQLGPLQNLKVLLGDLHSEVILVVGGQLEVRRLLQLEHLKLVLALL